MRTEASQGKGESMSKEKTKEKWKEKEWEMMGEERPLEPDMQLQGWKQQPGNHP